MASGSHPPSSGSNTHPGADLMQACGDGFGWSVTAEHMTFQDPGVFIPGHIRKVPEKTGKTRVTTVNNGRRFFWMTLFSFARQTLVLVWFIAGVSLVVQSTDHKQEVFTTQRE